MKWIDKSPVKGQQRTVRKFLFMAMQIGSEVRWLETAQWVEEFGYASQIENRRTIEAMKLRGESDIPPPRPDPISRTGPQWVPLYWQNN